MRLRNQVIPIVLPFSHEILKIIIGIVQKLRLFFNFEKLYVSVILFVAVFFFIASHFTYIITLYCLFVYAGHMTIPISSMIFFQRNQNIVPRVLPTTVSVSVCCNHKQPVR